jgi:hypothetical protein
LLGRQDHSAITSAQNARRDVRLANGQGKWSSSIRDEFENAAKDLTQAGVSEKCKRKALKNSYKYFDKLEAFK